MSDLREKRKAERSEAIHKTVEIISDLVPGGTTVYKLFTALVKPLHEERFDEWVRDITLRLHKLEQEEKIDLKELSQNEEFNTVITKATLLAQQNHQTDKIEALKNVVINSSIRVTAQSLEMDLTNSFLELINRISPTHILILRTIQDPVKIATEKGVNDFNGKVENGQFIYKIHPELESQQGKVNIFWVEILNAGLVIQNSMRGANELKHAAQPKLTEAGREFLEMISVI